ncbi:hypothetical protein BWQ93_01350 [Sphingopyxis sp. QXT-31]|uniref:AHH domain-containing protein n=1 Tax=Sphingopyxis sp. QXT-31 TaxID=1357916 RepID=UPI000979831C|nr:AHH domain-containing protein [Sphingopyxis sp. QXT-31]APZ97285.1 hypothetical protein BWQ93_01350 [Sphingopyxis sp. QXT-31]
MAGGDPPGPPRCRWSGAAPAEAGYQRHHLIPVALLQRPQMAAMFADLCGEGFVLHRFDLNGLVLPGNERLAWQSGHALHRGPHQAYSDVVAARVEQIRAWHAGAGAADPPAARRVAAMRLRLLQDTLRRALTDRHGAAFWLNRRDPMRLFADRPYLDAAIERLFGE